MQGKGIVKFFLVVMILVTLVQYLFIVPTSRVENDAERYAQQIVDSSEEEDPVQLKDIATKAVRTYIDSMSNETVFKIPMLKDYTYQELKSQQLAFGLDLKGGMSVVLQIDLRKLIYALAQSSKDPTLIAALDKASEAQKTEQADYVTLFANAWQEVRGDKRLAPIFQRNEILRDEINYETTDGQVIRILRTKADETVDLTYNLLKQRIDKLGVVQPNVSLDSERDLIIVELPGVDNPERAREFLQAAANLEFFATYRGSDQAVSAALTQANEKLRTILNTTEERIPVIDTVYTLDSLGIPTDQIASIDTTYETNSLNGPLFDIMSPSGGAVIGVVEKNNLNKLKSYLNREEIKSLFPRDLRFRYSREPFTSTQGDDEEASDEEEKLLYSVYAIKMPRSGEALLSGDHVTDASAQPDPQSGQIAVSLRMDQTGAKIWGQMTTEAAKNNEDREIAILLDNEVVSAPSVNEPITGGSSSITGGFGLQEATDLSSILEVGKLPAETKIIQESVVGPSLGKDNIKASITAIVIGIMTVIVFMMFYYGVGGIISVLALILNLLFIFGALASYGTVLTVPGVAGIILTIGMAVDANVIIYERIREELREGKSIAVAISDGFTNSYSAIIDANVTTILTAFVLAYFGLGPIKGFAVVLIIGVLSSLFTAVLVGRLMVASWMKRKKTMSFSTSMTKNAFSGMNIDWVGKRKMAYTLSSVIIVLGLISMGVRGFDLGVDFKGGYSYTVDIAQDATLDIKDLRTSLTAAFDGNAPVVKAVDGSTTYNIVTDYPIDLEELVTDSDTLSADQQGMIALHNGFKNAIGTDLDFDNFSHADGIGTHVSSFSQVGPTIADDIARSSFYAAIFALLLIFLYIFLRFNKWQYSLGAVAALFHDTLIVLGLFSLGWGIFGFNMEIDQPFIAAILTVIGYSINDTVVVFDRIREYLNNYSSGDKKTVINAAINSTVSRTVITSLTTLFVVLVLFLFGGATIKGFSFAILIGVLVGTYSSIFVASPLVYDLTDDNLATKKKDEKKHFSRAIKNT